jgi:hypothetical protein
VWLASRTRRDGWRLLTFGGFATSVVLLLLLLPFTWSGGGGPPGNRYLFNSYPVLFFLLPPITATWHGVVGWIGGTVFTARMLIDPFAAAKFTWLLTEKGLARRLPVELTMAQDLPVMLAQPLRGRIQYRYDPGLLLYFLDQNAWPPEPQGMWTSGSGRADIIVRSAEPIDHLVVEAESPIRTILTVRLGGRPVTVPIIPGQVFTFDVPASGVRGRAGYAYLLTTRSTEGFVPHLRDPQSGDYRNLGAQLRFRPITASAKTASRS